MSEWDATLQTILIYYFMPFFLICLGIRRRIWTPTRRKSFEAWYTYKVSRITHSAIEDEKQFLFGSMTDLMRTQRVDTLNLLEIGIGGGMNFRHYPCSTKVTAVEPNVENQTMVLSAFKENRDNIQNVKFYKGVAEDMYWVKSNSFDAVVSTLTLCTVTNPKAVLDEVHRVLKPGGKLYYLEHTTEERGGFIKRTQDRLRSMWGVLFGGCRVNRDLPQLMRRFFQPVEDIHVTKRMRTPFVRNAFVYGTATKVAVSNNNH